MIPQRRRFVYAWVFRGIGEKWVGTVIGNASDIVAFSADNNIKITFNATAYGEL